MFHKTMTSKDKSARDFWLSKASQCPSSCPCPIMPVSTMPTSEPEATHYLLQQYQTRYNVSQILQTDQVSLATVYFCVSNIQTWIVLDRAVPHTWAPRGSHIYFPENTRFDLPCYAYQDGLIRFTTIDTCTWLGNHPESESSPTPKLSYPLQWNNRRCTWTAKYTHHSSIFWRRNQFLSRWLITVRVIELYVSTLWNQYTLMTRTHHANGSILTFNSTHNLR